MVATGNNSGDINCLLGQQIRWQVPAQGNFDASDPHIT